MPTARTNGHHALARLMAIADVADVLGVEVRHVQRLVHERRVPFIKWGHLLRFDPEEIQEWIDGFRQPPGRAQATPPRRTVTRDS